MVTRRQSREWVLQLLVQFDLNPPLTVSDAISEFWEMQEDVERTSLEAEEFMSRVVFSPSINAPQYRGREDDSKALESYRKRLEAYRKRLEDHGKSLEEAKAFVAERVKGVMECRDALDSEIAQYLRNWSLYRLGTVERNILRFGAWEISRRMEVPAPITINECVDLAKYFSETKAARFVNGVLDSFAKDFAKKSQEFTPDP